MASGKPTGAGPSGKETTVAAIILAAGSSRRFGADNKLLALVDGEPLLRRVAGQFLRSRAGRIVVVTGHQREAIATALADLDIQLVHNDRHLQGMGYTVAAGVRALGETVRCAVITPGDLPGLTAALIDRLIMIADVAGFDRIVYPTLPTGEQRNPVLWPRRFFVELAALTGDAGARGLIQHHKGDAMPISVDDASMFLDIDRPEDLRNWVKRGAKP